MTIYIKNKHTFNKLGIHGHIIDIDRSSIFGNPYSHLKNSKAEFIVSSREESITAYKNYFQKKILNDEKFRHQIFQIIKYIELGYDIYLLCWCKPKDCHGDIIKEYIESKMRK